jgi:hypothetical protein
MPASKVVLALFLLAPALGACHRDRCLSECAQRQKELRCEPRHGCKETCDELRESTPCSAAMRGWGDCIMALPTSGWECNQASQLVPKETSCTDARAKVVACISKFPQWPPPKPSPAATPPRH